jgi:hypothetical protein
MLVFIIFSERHFPSIFRDEYIKQFLVYIISFVAFNVVETKIVIYRDMRQGNWVICTKVFRLVLILSSNNIQQSLLQNGC